MAPVAWEQFPASPGEIETFTLSYLPFVQALAGRVYRRLPQGTSVDVRDLTQAGIVGLVNAARTYDPQAGVSFLFYATFRIRGEMLDTLRGLDGAPRQLRRLERRMKTVASALAPRLNREPTQEEILQELGLDGSEVRDKTAALAAMPPAYTTDHAAAQLPTRADSHPDFICAHAERRTWLGRAVRTLSQRNRRLIWLYYSGEKTMKEIALVLRVNESRISQMHKSALRAMAKSLGDSGIRSSRDLGACS
jgi:RNA polymerase sigma factor FliA